MFCHSFLCSKPVTFFLNAICNSRNITAVMTHHKWINMDQTLVSCSVSVKQVLPFFMSIFSTLFFSPHHQSFSPMLCFCHGFKTSGWSPAFSLFFSSSDNSLQVVCSSQQHETCQCNAFFLRAFVSEQRLKGYPSELKQYFATSTQSITTLIRLLDFKNGILTGYCQQGNRVVVV